MLPFSSALAHRELATAGCKSVVLEQALVGDGEDVPYTSFCIEALTSKASSEFKITGNHDVMNTTLVIMMVVIMVRGATDDDNDDYDEMK